MTHEQVEALVKKGQFPDGAGKVELIETHISWVILTDFFAYKIKKPVRFSFLDFSTLPLRKHCCEEEVRLNRRLTDIYLDTIPIVYNGRFFGIGMEGETVDYAVKMKRVESARQMDLLLKRGLVRPEDVEALAITVARFHRSATVVRQHFDETATMKDFADLASVSPVLTDHLDEKFSTLIPDWIALAQAVIKKLSRRFFQRVEENFVRDVHGDLHCRNIFLLEKPVIFDCIEFNRHLRINDVLSELAFLAMDLDHFGCSDFKAILVETYKQEFPCFLLQEDDFVFQYFLFYRSSVRLKIAGLLLREELEEPTLDMDAIQQDIRSLSGLCSSYAAALKELL
jgi:hypothetical protein